METCTFDCGCTNPAIHAHLCNAHYQRMRMYGYAKPDRLPMPERFWSFVDKTGECWEWTGGRNKNKSGYGAFRIGHKQFRAHRVSYELLVGPIPEGLTLDHLCQNKGCVNPDHLEPVTAAENISRQGRRMTACRRGGHPFDAENTYLRNNGTRGCRACARAACMAWYYRRAAKVTAL